MEPNVGHGTGAHISLRLKVFRFCTEQINVAHKKELDCRTFTHIESVYYRLILCRLLNQERKNAARVL